MITKAKYNSDNFNQLPEVEEAIDFVRSGDLLNKNLNEIGEVFIKHGVEKKWGLALLHKHFLMGKDEIPLMKILETDDSIEYRTAPQQMDAAADYWPSIFSFNCSPEFLMQPIEFTTDILARESNELLNSKSDFLSELKELLVKNGLQHVFGIICAKRGLQEDSRFVENNFTNRVSLLKIIKRTEITEMNLGETSWYFNSNTAPMVCTVCPMDPQTYTHQGPRNIYHKG